MNQFQLYPYLQNILDAFTIAVGLQPGEATMVGITSSGGDVTLTFRFTHNYASSSSLADYETFMNVFNSEIVKTPELDIAIGYGKKKFFFD